MRDEILEYTEVRESSGSERVRLRYRNGVFTVVVPLGLDLDVGKVVEGNRGWFRSLLGGARSYRRSVPERCFEEGELFEVLGDEKRVKVERRRSNEVGEKFS
jgi:hypothetical protein